MKSEKYKGYTITFHSSKDRHKQAKIGAKIPKISKRIFVSLRSTKERALKDAKIFINFYIKDKKRRR
ncbi:MAG: hypothetical protein DRN66_03750 [Candidatus Nanohalarchaeota archaeon]|nr:MAG: hypothetical protein DRN66_03750 [Candidatus Nanohaloarchaeota archaeon]